MASSREGDEIEWFDVIVVGGGIMGSCVAYELAKRGGGTGTGSTSTTNTNTKTKKTKASTLLLEQFDFLHNAGSSHGESRTLRLTYPEPYYPPLVQQSSLLWEVAQSDIGYRVLYPTNQLDMGPSDDPSLQAVVSSCLSNSIPVRVLDPVQLSSEFCGRVSIPDGWIGVVTEGAAVIKPTKAVSMFQSLALRYGALLKDNIKVTSITRGPHADILLSTASGRTFRCNKCVVTAGPWMHKLLVSNSNNHNNNNNNNREIIIPSIQPLETTICYWKIKAGYEMEYSISGGFPSFASYGNPYVYGTPSLEYPGLIKIAVHGGQPCDPDKRTWTWASNNNSQQQMMDYLRNWIQLTFRGRVDPDKDGPVLTQSCMYSVTPDEDFLIDFLGGDLANDVVIAGGFSGHGFKMGPVIARIVADMVLNHNHKDDASELRPFKLDRFHHNPAGNLKDFTHQVGLHSPT